MADNDVHGAALILVIYNVDRLPEKQKASLQPLTLRVMRMLYDLLDQGDDKAMTRIQIMLLLCRICDLSNWCRRTVIPLDGSAIKCYMVIPLGDSDFELMYLLPGFDIAAHLCLDHVEEVPKMPETCIHHTYGTTVELETACRQLMRQYKISTGTAEDISEKIEATRGKIAYLQSALDAENERLKQLDMMKPTHGNANENVPNDWVARVLDIDLNDQPPEIEREDQDGPPLKKARTD